MNISDDFEKLFPPLPILETKINDDWPEILKKINLSGLTQNAAENVEMVIKSGQEIILHISKGHKLLFTPNIIQRIEQALAIYYCETIKIRLHFNESVKATPTQNKHLESKVCQQEDAMILQQDTLLQQLRQEFSAELVKYTIIKSNR
jgi:DNA polymerase III subunit gamma/tau